MIFAPPEPSRGNVQEIWAFLRDDGQGEGLVGSLVDNVAFPLVTSDPRLISMMRELAIQVAKASKTKITLVKFSTRTELEVFE